MMMFIQEYEARRKLIKRLIFWGVTIAGILALFLTPTPVKSLTIIGNANEYNTQSDTKPLDPCREFGGCVWQIETYQKETMLESVAAFLFDIIYFLVFLAGAIAVIFLILGALRMITASGNADTVKNARSTIINALIGLVLVIMAITIINILQTVLINLQFDVS